MKVTPKMCACVALMSALFAPLARAQWAVIDVAAVTRLTAELQTLAQSLQTEREQYLEAQQQLSSMTGNRGMQDLLAGVRRNYLPGSWAQLSAALAGHSSTYPALAGAIRAAVLADTSLTASQFARLSPAARAQLSANRHTAALLQALSEEALANASGRFAQLGELITAIGSARDQKSILDLTARISAEQTMVDNEQTKLGVLYSAARAERWADREREREEAIAAEGDFATRFQPTP